MPKKRLYIFIILYFVTIIITTISYMVIEAWPFIDSLYHTIINVVAFGGVGEVHPMSQLGRLFTVFSKIFSFFCVAGIAYSALQTSLFERVDRITYERIRKVKEQPINIFISYRRADSSGVTGRIYDRLSSFFGSSHVFMDLDTIAPGEDFLQVIQRFISSCDIMVAVIGHDWIGMDGDNKKIYKHNDFVRIEIEYALQKNIQIIPVLVHDARMPPASDVPEEIVTLLGQQAVSLSDMRWNYDTQKLIDSIDSVRQRE